MQVRMAKQQGFEGILALYRQLNPDDPVIDDGRDTRVFAEILDSGNFHLFVAEAQGRIVATCYLNLIPNLTRNAAPYAIIENVVTDKDHRNQGIGKTIVQCALAYAWEADCYKVMLQTGSRREFTHAFYKTCGFSGNDKFAFVARSPMTRGSRRA
jgi:GNAT superfamily N-acetyltransferase